MGPFVRNLVFSFRELLINVNMYAMKNYRIQHVLVPIDFSAVSHNALQTAIAICQRQLASLMLVHVIENSYWSFPPEAGGAAGNLLPELIRSANENLSRLAKEVRTQHDLVVHHLVQSGNPADEICLIAHLRKIDLVVMGTHGTSGWREFFLGSNAYRVVKNATCAVMTIPGDHQWLDFKKVLFPIRMVPHALEKYEYLRPIVRKNNSSLIVAGIVKQNDTTGPTRLLEMKALVDEVRKQITEDDVTCHSELHYTQQVAAEVLAIADRENPDLIVITATLDNTLRDFFLGPYTQNIVNHAKHPVLSIRPNIFGHEAADYQTEHRAVPSSGSVAFV